MSTMDGKNPAHAAEETSMLTGLEEKAAEKAAEVLVQQVMPKITDYGKMLWSGRQFLILGPARSGKTSFFTYLEDQLLEPEKTTSVTVGVHKGDNKILRIGPDKSLILRVRKPRDVAGQAPIHQIEHIKDYTPNCIVIVLDATKFFGVPAADSALEWLRQFCGYLDVLLNSNKKIAKKLRSMIVVMNKWDKIAAETKNADEEKEYRELYQLYVREILDNNLHNSFYIKDGINNIEIISCALVSHTRFGTSLAKQLIQSIALSLSRR
jgi:GTPase SAR1 family protein